MELVARFTVTEFEPTDLHGIDDDWVGAVTMRKDFTAGIHGSSIAHFVSSGEEGSRGYLAVERGTCYAQVLFEAFQGGLFNAFKLALPRAL